MIHKEALAFLKTQEFIDIATCNLDNRPNVAPKFLLKIEKSSIYVVDYVINRTWHNITINPQVSISAINEQTLKGYQINGEARIIQEGPLYQRLLKEFQAKQIVLSTKRLIQALHTNTKSGSFEVSLSERIAIFKITVKEVVRIGLGGQLERRKI